MPWKEGYTVSDECSLKDDEVRWPEGRRCCVSVVVDLSVAAGPAGLSEADLRASPTTFGMHEGLELLLEALGRHGLRATFVVPAAMARMLEGTLRRLIDAGHEVAAGGFRHEDVGPLPVAEEAARLAATTEILAEVTGTPPAGWFTLPRQNDAFAVGTYSENTAGLLIDAGYRYLGNGLADDIPHYWVADFEARRAILTMPYYYHFDDQYFLMFPREGSGLEHMDALAANWRAEFEAQYRRGRHFHMVLHPYLIGWCNRIQALAEFLRHMADYPDLWNPTHAECADYWLRAYPPETALKLEPSIWRHHAGSLS